MTLRWLFADQLGPHYLDTPDQRVLLIESRRVFARRRFHRQKAHLVLSALRHRAAELGEQAVFIQAETYADALAEVGEPVSVGQPTSYAADAFARAHPLVTVVPDRGYATSPAQFTAWARSRGRRRLLMEDFYREQRRRLDLLMDGDQPAGGRWNFDEDNREPPPRGRTQLGVPEPYWPTEDDIDAQVRADLDRWERDGWARFVGPDRPRWAAATRAEALAQLDRFVRERLATFGPPEDAMLADDRSMSHSMLSPALNLGLLHPLEAVRAAEAAYRDGTAPLNSVEGYVRQVIGWREYVWGIYWCMGNDYRARNALGATEPVPDWLWNLDAAGEVTARCLADVLHDLREDGWVHHIPRLMVLGNYALQRGFDPAEMTKWFHYNFLDGYDWVMLPNVVGMSQHADGGLMATKPYAAGGAYINRMSDYCGGCPYDPKVRLGDNACPYTAGYWAFLDRNAERLAANPRVRRQVTARLRLPDLEAVVEQERRRSSDPP